MGFELPWWRPGTGGTFSYLSEKRDDAYLARAYGKMAYASAGGYDTIWGKNNVPGPGATGETIYQLVGGDKFRPKNHLVSINTSGIPETFGAVRKGAYTYRTYDGSLGNIPQVGSVQNMSWGWSYADQGISGESFSGKVTGYNIQSNTEGGFDVTVNLIGENAAVSVAGFSIDVTIDVSSPNVTDAAGNTYSANDLFSAVSICSIEAQKMPPGQAKFNNGINGLVVEVPENYDTPDTEATTDNPSTMSKKAYVTVESIVMLTNKFLEGRTECRLEFASGYDTANFDPSIYSANPLEVLLPGQGKYGTRDFKVPGSTGKLIQIKNIYVAASVIAEFGKAAKAEAQVGGTTSKPLSIKSFYDKLFDLINQNIGLPFSLTLTNSGEETDKNLYIADLSKIRDVPATNIDTVRSANLSANLDSDAQKQFFVLFRTPEEIKSNVVAAQDNKGKQAPNYGTLVANVGLKADSTNTNALKSANKDKIAAVLASATDFGTSAPWNLSVVLDGSGGWKYGGRISYSKAAVEKLIPPTYKVGFAISDIQHSVQDGDWTVSLSTMCRIFK